MATLSLEPSWKARLSGAYARLLRQALCPAAPLPLPLPPAPAEGGRSGGSMGSSAGGGSSSSSAGGGTAGRAGFGDPSRLPSIQEEAGPGPGAPASGGAASGGGGSGGAGHGARAALVLGLRRTLAQLAAQLVGGQDDALGLPLTDAHAAEVRS